MELDRAQRLGADEKDYDQTNFVPLRLLFFKYLFFVLRDRLFYYNTLLLNQKISTYFFLTERSRCHVNLHNKMKNQSHKISLLVIFHLVSFRI